MDTVSVSRDIAAPPEAVWALVTDLPRMGEWSPENTGGAWKGGTGPSLGAKFKGTNAGGKRTWSTDCTVTTCDAPRRFAFRVTAGPMKIADWAYDIEPTDAGSRVTETWTDARGGMGKFLGKLVSGVADRATHNRAGMEQTLTALAAALEQRT